jgi:predicted aldo/keto reductase-like oxidoreductase
MFSINPAFDMAPPSENVLDTFHKDFKNQQYAGIRPDRQELYQLCESRGVAITVMKTLGGGKLLSPAQTPFAKPLTVPQCIHYALTRPGGVSALVGCQSRAQVLDAARYEALSDGERDYAEVVGSFQTFAGNCVYCGHCRPCPSHIDIASVHRYLDIARVNDVAPPGVLSHYQALTAPAGDCIFCGACEERCPFGVSIMENMKSALAIFGR